MVRRTNDLDDLLESYTREGSQTNLQTARVVTAMIAKIQTLQEDLNEIKQDRKEENSTRIQIQQTKKGIFEYFQFTMTFIVAVGMLVIAIIELTKK